LEEKKGSHIEERTARPTIHEATEAKNRWLIQDGSRKESGQKKFLKSSNRSESGGKRERRPLSKKFGLTGGRGKLACDDCEMSEGRNLRLKHPGVGKRVNEEHRKVPGLTEIVAEEIGGLRKKQAVQEVGGYISYLIGKTRSP